MPIAVSRKRRLVSATLAAVVVTAGGLVASTSSASSAAQKASANLPTALSNVVPFGDAGFFGSMPGAVARGAVGMAASLSGRGYWLVASDGGVFTFGDAGFFGSLGDVELTRPIVGMSAAPPGSRSGYWLVASDGGVFAFGGAQFYGSLGGATLNRPIVGMVAAPGGRGYWLVASDGGVFAFGSARFFGSLGDVTLNRPIVGMTASRTGHGYWLVAADGGVFAFGDARFFGSLGGRTLTHPIVGIAATGSNLGYWLLASNGAVFPLGGARFFGADPTSPPVAGAIVATPTERGYWVLTTGLKVVTLPTQPPTQQPSHIIPDFEPPVPDAPIIRAHLDDTGLHFDPSHIAAGTYNIAFSDTRTNRTPHTDVAVHIYVSGPGYSMLSVHAGETGGGLLCSGAYSEGVTVDHIDLSVAINPYLTIDPSPACPTPVT